MKPLCKHCKREPATRSRGLGYWCYKDVTIREQYPRTFIARREETLEDLERLIAERYPTMPKRGEHGEG